MKRCILISMIVLASAGAWAQDLSTFQTGFTAFSAELAPTLSYNAATGNNWSDAYIGNFPHFGVGAAIGATTVSVDGMRALFDSMSVAMPDALEALGLPIPAVALSARIGGLFLPFDLGVKGMLLPAALTSKLASSGVSMDYMLVGGNVRYAVLKEGALLPDVSIGAGYNRLSGAIVAPLGVAGQSFTFTEPDSTPHTLAVTDPDLALRWGTDSFDFTLQVSKRILFVEPYAGLGLSLGKSSVKGGIESALTYDDVPVTAAQLEGIKADLLAAGIAVPELSANGFLFGSENAEPTLRVYGGVTLSLIIVKFDVSALYVPATKSLGAQGMFRIQL